MLKGIAASSGIGIGKAVLVREEELEVVKNTVLFIDEEQQRFLDAVEVFVSELEEARLAVLHNIGPAEADILGAQIAIVRDPELIKEVLRSIERQRVNAEYAFSLICNGYIALFSSLEDELMSARSADFHDIRNRMLRILLGLSNTDLSTVPEGSIVVADDIPPSQAAGIDTKRIRGIVTRGGTRFSHIAIIARALQMPAVVTISNVFDVIEGGETLVVDGHNGTVTVNPAEKELEHFLAIVDAEENMRQELGRYRQEVTATTDGRRIYLASNLAMESELEVICENNADGIGLFRTEFLYMGRSSAPSEQEQYEIYKRVTSTLGKSPVIIRTLDIGGDKEIPYLFEKKEENPFLGHRAVRYCLDHPEIFKTQLAAMLRAAIYGNIRIMIPMISYLTELRRVKVLLEEVKEELTARGEEFRGDVPLGIMIETPAAALCAGELAREADFFSIGTNDLTQYVLAVDRSNGNVAALYNPMHPSVLRLIDMTVRAAHAAGIPAGVCGEAASDPMMIPFLVGVGVDELSVSSGALLLVRSLVNNLSYSEWQMRIPEILSLPTYDETRRYLTEYM